MRLEQRRLICAVQVLFRPFPLAQAAVITAPGINHASLHASPSVVITTPVPYARQSRRSRSEMLPCRVYSSSAGIHSYQRVHQPRGDSSCYTRPLEASYHPPCCRVLHFCHDIYQALRWHPVSIRLSVSHTHSL
ncbi:hypothetical protein F4678DRAFT_159699 [Xylaria arbuscula]|nr:hypothetical protein F4678DRAFT_159699 [Xylaria arbuscula]